MNSTRTQPHALSYYDGRDRTMRRTTIGGEVPVNVDGRPSRMLRQPNESNTP